MAFRFLSSLRQGPCLPVTIGSKYSVQITPFGEDTPVIKEGFTAVDNTTQKVYDLSGQSKRDYDLTFIDIVGKEIKYPIVVK